MFKNYLKTALRNLRRNKGYAFINIIGLTVGIAAFLLIFLVIKYETSFDNFHKNRDRIYRVVTEFHQPQGVSYTRGSSFPAGRQLKLDYPQFEHVARINANEGTQVTVLDGKGGESEKKFKEQGLFFVEPEFFDIFNFPWVIGDPKTAIADPYTAALTKTAAIKYFGDWKNAVGKTIKLDNKKVCKITGILEDVPTNSDFPMSLVISFKTTNNDTSSDWVSTYGDLCTFVVLPSGMSKAQLDQDLKNFTKKHKPAEYASDLLASQPLKEMHFDKRFGTYNRKTFSRELIAALSLIGGFLLIIACINFVNLATAHAVTRAKEVGVRKVLGGKKKELIIQFLSETLLVTLGAIILAIGIAFLTLPFLNGLLKSHVKMDLDLSMISFLIGVVVAVTLLSGIYPAFVMSRFNPITALKTKFAGKASGGITLRRALVVVQFAIAQVLIIGTLVVVSQMDYFKHMSLGFDKEGIVNFPLRGDSIGHTKLEALKNDMQRIPGVINLSFSTFSITDNGHWNSDFKFDNSTKKSEFDADLKWSDADAFKTFNLKIVAGRQYYPSDTTKEIVVNETFVRKLGIRNPEEIIGKKINMWDGQIVAPIVGVVRDFNGNTVTKPIDAVIMAPWKDVYENMSVKIESAKLKQALPAIQAAWSRSFPDNVYEYQFLDDKIATFFSQETELSQLYKIFAGIAIFISCLGLYGLISFMAVQKTKEVGIRKVLGASVSNIIYMFSKEFTILIAIAFVIAAPLAWYFMNDWLHNFAFRQNIGVMIFLLTIVGSVLIAWISVGYKAIRAAVENPVKSLRTE